MHPIAAPILLILCVAVRDPHSPASLLAAAVVWLLAGLLLWRTGSRQMPDASIATDARVTTFVAVALLGTLVAAALHTQARFNSLAELTTTGLTALFAIGAVPLAALTTMESRTRALKFTAIVIAVIAFAAIVEAFDRRSRPFGPFLDVNVLGALFNAGALTAVSLIVSRQTGSLQWLVMVVIAGGQAITASRGADLALGAGFTAIAVAGWRHHGSIPKLAGAGAVLVAAHMSISVLPFSLRSSGTFELLKNPELVASHEPSATARIAVWESTYAAYRNEGPWFGTGLGTYPIIYPHYRSTRDLQTSGERAHSDYLERLLEGGPLAMSALIVFGLGLPLFLWIRGLRRTELQREESTSAVLRSGAAATCLALGIHAAVNFILAVPALGLLFALNLANALNLPQCTLTAQRSSSRLRFVGAAAAILVPPMILLMALGAWLINPSSRDFQKSNQAKWLQLANLGTTVQPSNPWFREAVVGAELGAVRATKNANQRKLLISLTRGDIERWLDANDCDTRAWESLAQLAAIDQEGAGTTAVEAYDHALRCRPQSLGLRVELAAQLERINRANEAYSVLRDGIQWLPIARDRDSILRWVRAGTQLSKTQGPPEDKEVWAGFATSIEHV